MTTIQTFHASGFDVPQRRQTRALVDVAMVYQKHQQTLEQYRGDYCMMLLESALIREYAFEPGDEDQMVDALFRAWIGIGELEWPPVRMVQLARDLYVAINQFWDAPPFNDPNLTIYELKRHGYHANALVIEITYREPTLSTPAAGHDAAVTLAGLRPLHSGVGVVC